MSVAFASVLQRLLGWMSSRYVLYVSVRLLYAAVLVLVCEFDLGSVFGVVLFICRWFWSRVCFILSQSPCVSISVGGIDVGGVGADGVDVGAVGSGDNGVGFQEGIYLALDASV